jgi:Uma2 family endonuclease
MSTATTTTSPADPAPLEMPGGPVARVPSLDELYRLTEVPDRRVVFRGVDWSFYEELVDSLPASSRIHVDYDGRDLEVMAKGRRHENVNRRLDQLIVIIADEWDIPYTGLNETTWKRPALSRGLESDNAYYFLPEKLAQDAAARERGSDDIVDYPDPDLAIEVDISRPQVDRAGIYAALRVAEIWRFDEGQLIFERLTPDGTYEAVEASGFLPFQPGEMLAWALGGPGVERDWLRWARAEIRRKREDAGLG